MNTNSTSKRKKSTSANTLKLRKSLDLNQKAHINPFQIRPQSVMTQSTGGSPRINFKNPKIHETMEGQHPEKSKLSDKKLLLIDKECTKVSRHSLPITPSQKKSLQEWYEQNEIEEERELKDLLSALVFSK